MTTWAPAVPKAIIQLVALFNWRLCPYDCASYVIQLFSYRNQKHSNDKERDREWSGWHQVTEGGQSLPRPHLPSFVQNINRETWKNIREIFENVNRQSYPSEMYLKLSTDNLTQLCTKHQQRNMIKTSEKYLKLSTHKRDVRFWFSLYFWPKPCQYRLYLISRFPELFICESLQSWPTDQRPSFSYISFTFTKAKLFLLVLNFYQITQRLKKTCQSYII